MMTGGWRAALLVGAVALAACDGGDPAGSATGDAAPDASASTDAAADAATDTASTPDSQGASDGATASDSAGDTASADAAKNTDATDDTGMDTASCPDPTGVRPPAQGEMAGVVDPINSRLVLFGGDVGFPVQCESRPDYVGSTWALDLACMQWTELQPSRQPPDRGRHAAAYDSQEHRMLVFGGRWRATGTQGAYDLFDDVWAFDFDNDNWTAIETTGTGPSARWASAAAYDPKAHRLIVTGGNVATSGAVYAPDASTFALDLATGAWSKIAGPGPSARLFADAAYDPQGHRMILFGGTVAFFGPFLNDTWALDLTTDTWSQIGQGSPKLPEPRIRPTLVTDEARGRIVMFGGHDDGIVGNRNDVWHFRLDTELWQRASVGDLHDPASPSPAFCEFPPDFVVTDMDAPERREAHVMAGWPAGDIAIVFGGKTDCGIADDVWTLALDGFAWSEAQEATVGESCIRAGGEGCHDLCF